MKSINKINNLSEINFAEINFNNEKVVEDLSKFDIFKTFSMVDHHILSEYNEDCSHPNAPWSCCCGCGLGGCKANKWYDENDLGWDI